MYQFKNLNYIRIIDSTDERDLLFLRTEEMLRHEFQFYASIPEALEKWLQDDQSYYVMHDNVMTKGKMQKLMGMIVVANKPEILDFVQHAIQSNDLRPLRLMPVENFRFVICLTDDDSALVFEQ